MNINNEYIVSDPIYVEVQRKYRGGRVAGINCFAYNTLQCGGPFITPFANVADP